MTQAVTLTRVGNSRAVIIPAKILKSLEITENTILTLSDDNERITISKSGAVRPEPIFPKVRVPEPDEQEDEQIILDGYEDTADEAPDQIEESEAEKELFEKRKNIFQIKLIKLMILLKH